MNPKDRNIWITGASSGIGRALAIEFARSGGRLLLSARCPERLEETAGFCRANGAEVQIQILDLADSQSVASKASKAEKLLGPIDVLVNAAGVGQRGMALETDTEVARHIMEVNFWGAVSLARAVIPGMVARGYGQLVVVSSVTGKFGAPRRSMYSASKHALHGWFDSLREELLNTGLEVTLLVPGWVKTKISENALESDGSTHGGMDEGQASGISPEECAKRAMAAITEGRHEQLIGGIECAGVYLNRLWPGLFRRILRKKGIG